MKTVKKYLALDYGAESGRAIVGILSDKKIILEEVHRFQNKLIRIHGNLHWDIYYLYDELITGLKKAVSKRHSDISSIAVDTWGVDFGLISKDDQILGTPYAYRDTRTDGMLEKAFHLMPKNDIYKLTGNQFMQFNTAFQLLSMVKSKNTLLKYADRLLFMPDLFNFLLTGEKKSEYTIASTSQLLNARNKRWEYQIISKFNIPRKIFPEIVMPGDKIGKLSQLISDQLGLKNVDVVAVGSHDTASAVAAVPNLKNDWVFISSGTWSLIGIETEKPIINKKSFDYNFTNEGGVGGKVRFLKNVMGMWIIQQLKKEWESGKRKYSYSQLGKMAERADPFQFIIDVDSPEFLNPPNMVEAVNDYCNRMYQKYPKSKGEYVRMVLESLALKYRTIIEQLNLVSRTKFKQINIVGGGSQNELLNQFTANATGLEVITGPVESTAFGNILYQAISDGTIRSLKDGRKIVKNSIESVRHVPKEKTKWDKIYSIYRKNIS